MGVLSGSTIVLVIHSFDRSVINRGKMPLPPNENMEWWAGGISTAIAFLFVMQISMGTFAVASHC